MRSILSLPLVILALNIKIGESFFYSNNNIELTYDFYARDMPNGVKKINIKNVTETNYKLSRTSVFIVHGFNSNPDTKSFIKLREELLKKEDLNIFMVDWQKQASGFDYFRVVNNVRLIAKQLANFIKESFISPNKTHCIGHSLGSHVCGYAGKEMKLKRITGLDPAGPLFGQKTSERLDLNDAEFVDVIHTDSTLGFNSPIGHLDFYPNGGGSQPNCNDKIAIINENETNIFDDNRAKFINFGLMTCSHTRAIELYASTINSDCDLIAKQCSSYSSFINNKCECDSPNCSIKLGYNTKAAFEFKYTKFYLKTSGITPFCL